MNISITVVDNGCIIQPGDYNSAVNHRDMRVCESLQPIDIGTAVVDLIEKLENKASRR